MTARATLVAFVLFVGTIQAEEPLPADDLSRAYDGVLADLRAGKDRQSLADRLKPVVEKNPSSNYARLVQSFLADLTASAKNTIAKMGEPPEKRLAESRMPLYLLKHAENWDRPLTEFVKKQPNDPAAELVAADRIVISRLIPLLADRSPTRSEDPFSPDGNTPQPRVCDLALALIEYHGKCRFHNDSIHRTSLHQLPEAERMTVTEHVAAWWEEMKDKSVAAGVRAQLAHARSYPEKVWMAKSLARLAEGQKTDDREFALNVLREIVNKNRRIHVGASAAVALAELGDTSAVNIFYDEWKSWLGRPGLIHDSQIAFFLCKRGGRREWELLHQISLEEVRDGKGPGDGAVWSCVVNSGVAGKNPYAIPILGLVLDQTKNTGSRSVKSGSQEFSYADTACEQFQKQVGKEFGYQRDGTAEERLAAIKKAQAWWDKEGKAKYSFDDIEKKMVPANAPSSRSEK